MCRRELKRNELDAGFYLGDPRDYDPPTDVTGESTRRFSLLAHLRN